MPPFKYGMVVDGVFGGRCLADGRGLGWRLGGWGLFGLRLLFVLFRFADGDGDELRAFREADELHALRHAALHAEVGDGTAHHLLVARDGDHVFVV